VGRGTAVVDTGRVTPHGAILGVMTLGPAVFLQSDDQLARLARFINGRVKYPWKLLDVRPETQPERKRTERKWSMQPAPSFRWRTLGVCVALHTWPMSDGREDARLNWAKRCVHAVTNGARVARVEVPATDEQVARQLLSELGDRLDSTVSRQRSVRDRLADGYASLLALYAPQPRDPAVDLYKLIHDEWWMSAHKGDNIARPKSAMILTAEKVADFLRPGQKRKATAKAAIERFAKREASRARPVTGEVGYSFDSDVLEILRRLEPIRHELYPSRDVL
jgi:hypothetical protein